MNTSVFRPISTLFAVGSVCLLAACGIAAEPKSDHFTKSENCHGPSVVTLYAFADRKAPIFPEGVRLEECPNGKFYMQEGKSAWTEITKNQADVRAGILKASGRRLVRVVD
jgi:hypothetical protein